MFRSLRNRNYLLFFVGQSISLTGTWLQITALPWLVYSMTKSALLLGAVGFLNQIFILIFSPFAGVAADQYKKKNLLLLTQSLLMVQALLLAVLVLSGKLKVSYILLLAVMMGLVNAFDMPARQSFVVEMVGKEHLMNAIALNSMLFNLARLIGPAIAGVLIAAFGEGMCFLVNAASFTAVISALVLIKPPPRRVSVEKEEFAKKMSDGISYIRKSKQISSVLLLLSITGLVGAFPMILMPIFVKDVYGLGASQLGLFMSSMGFGALIGALKLAAKKDTQGIEKTIFSSALWTGILTIAFAFSRNSYLTCLILLLVGYFVLNQMALTNTLIQLTAPDEMRGRVMSFFIMAFMGFAPIGSIIAGYLAHVFSAPVAVFIGGILCILAWALLKRKDVKP